MNPDLVTLALRLERADTEFRRARSTGEQPRLQNAGTSFRVAMYRLFKAAKEARAAAQSEGKKR